MDDSNVLTGSNDNTARLWDIMTTECLHVFEGEGPITNVGLSGQYILASFN